MLLAAVDLRRPTVDVGTLARNVAGDHASIAAIIGEIATPRSPGTDDGVALLPDTITTVTIREEGIYADVRVTVVAQLGTARLKIKLDVNFGDPVTPAPTMVMLPSVRPAWRRSTS